MQSNNFLAYAEKMENLPEKEVKIYQAVETLIKEGRDLTTLRVSEISSRAGIGKGTVYEYFQSKEELLFRAIQYVVFNSAKNVLLFTIGDDSFKHKFYGMMDYLWENKLKEQTLHSIMEFMHNTESIQEMNQSDNIMNPDTSCAALKIVEEILISFVNLGLQEGIITETDPKYQKNVLGSQLLLFLFLGQEITDENRKKEIEDYVYEGFVMLLNLRHA